jgi:hypothetical protein
MKSFICETDCGELALTLRFDHEFQKFHIYLYDINLNFGKRTDLTFFKESYSCPIEPNFDDIVKMAEREVEYHYAWTNKDKFKEWLKNIFPYKDGKYIDSNKFWKFY